MVRVIMVNMLLEVVVPADASYFGNGAVGVGVNDYDYDVWGPQFKGQLIPQYDGAYDPTQTYTTTFADGDNVYRSRGTYTLVGKRKR